MIESVCVLLGDYMPGNGKVSNEYVTATGTKRSAKLVLKAASTGGRAQGQLHWHRYHNGGSSTLCWDPHQDRRV